MCKHINGYKFHQLKSMCLPLGLNSFKTIHFHSKNTNKKSVCKCVALINLSPSKLNRNLVIYNTCLLFTTKLPWQVYIACVSAYICTYIYVCVCAPINVKQSIKFVICFRLTICQLLFGDVDAINKFHQWPNFLTST